MTSWSKQCLGGLLAVGCLGAWLPANATSLAPANVREVAGAWSLFPEGQPGQDCHLTLSANGEAGSAGQGCERQWLGESPIAGWASKPDGITFAGKDRRTLLLLNPIGPDRFRGRTRQGVVLWLERVD